MEYEPLFVKSRWESLNKEWGLTIRQLELVTLLCTGYAPKEVARIMGISPKTVGCHLLRIYQRLQISGLQELLIHIFRVYLTKIGDE